MRRQRNVYLTTGTELVSNEDRTLLTIVDDTCGRHDTLKRLRLGKQYGPLRS